MIKNFIIVTGDNDFLRAEYLRRCRKAWSEKNEDSPWEEVDVTCSWSLLQNKLQSAGLFSSKRLLFLDHWFTPEHWEQMAPDKSTKAAEVFREILEPQAAELTVIAHESKIDRRTAVGKWLAGAGQQKAFEPLDYTQTVDWVMKISDEGEGPWPRKLAEHFLQRVGKINWSMVRPDRRTGKIDWGRVQQQFGHRGENLWQLFHLVSQINTYRADCAISPEAIDQLTPLQNPVIVWDLFDCLTQKNLPKALKLFRELLANDFSSHALLALLFSQMRVFATTTSAKEERISWDEVTQKTGLAPFRLQKAGALDWSSSQLKRAYQGLCDLDTNLKTGGLQTSTDNSVELNLAIEHWMVRSFG